MRRLFLFVICAAFAAVSGATLYSPPIGASTPVPQTAQACFLLVRGIVAQIAFGSCTPAPTPTPPPSPTPTPIPSPTGSASPSPTSSPGSNGCGTTTTFTNGVPYAATFKPYACASVWNQPLPLANIKYNPNDRSLVQKIYGGGTSYADTAAPGTNDDEHTIYYAAPTDPSVGISCAPGSTCMSGPPSSIHIPAQARAGFGTDHHLSVIQPDISGNVGFGIEYDFWNVSNPSSDWGTGGNTTINEHGDANCGSFLTADGRAISGGATASDICSRAGIFTINELMTGTAQHATVYDLECQLASGGSPVTVYPAQGSTAQCTDGSLEVPLGGLLWYDVACATTQARTDISLAEMTVLCSLNVYGAYFLDNGGGAPSAANAGGPGIVFESEEPSYAFCTGTDYQGVALSGLAIDPWFGNAPSGNVSGCGFSGNRWLIGGAGGNGVTGGEEWWPDGNQQLFQFGATAGNGGWVSHLHFLCAPPVPPSTTWTAC